MNRPAAIAPAQHTSDAVASRRPRPAAADAFARTTRRRSSAISATDSSTKIIFTVNTGFASFVVASTANMTSPDAALVQKPIHITRNNRSSDATGADQAQADHDAETGGKREADRMEE